MAQLLKETYTYRVEDEKESLDLIIKHMDMGKGVVEHRAVPKNKVSKGEIIESLFVITITHDFTK